MDEEWPGTANDDFWRHLLKALGEAPDENALDQELWRMDPEQQPVAGDCGRRQVLYRFHGGAFVLKSSKEHPLRRPAEVGEKLDGQAGIAQAAVSLWRLRPGCVLNVDRSGNTEECAALISLVS